MSDNVRIDVEGFKELRRELRALSLHRDLQPINKQAAEIPAAKARQFGLRSYPNLAGGTSRLGSRGVASIRALASQSKAYVAGGKATVPYYGGMDFGSGGAHPQFPKRDAGGRFIYPAIAETGEQIKETYTKGLDRLIAPVFPNGKIS